MHHEGFKDAQTMNLLRNRKLKVKNVASLFLVIFLEERREGWAKNFE